MSERTDDDGQGDLRTELLTDPDWNVVEIGAGNGRNFACYPTTMTRVHAIEPEPHLRSLTTVAPAAAPVPITEHATVTEHLPLSEASAGAVVFCLVLSSITNRTAALAETRRACYTRPAYRGSSSKPSPPPGACAPRYASSTPPCGR